MFYGAVLDMIDIDGKKQMLQKIDMTYYCDQKSALSVWPISLNIFNKSTFLPVPPLAEVTFFFRMTD